MFANPWLRPSRKLHLIYLFYQACDYNICAYTNLPRPSTISRSFWDGQTNNRLFALEFQLQSTDRPQHDWHEIGCNCQPEKSNTCSALFGADASYNTILFVPKVAHAHGTISKQRPVLHFSQNPHESRPHLLPFVA